MDIDIAKLSLDTANPRIVKADSQRQAYERLLIDQGEKIVNLAKHMAVHGLSPTDKFIVVPDAANAGSFVVVEGNRRTAILKILKNPSILDDCQGVKSGVIRGLREVAKAPGRVASIAEVECAHFATRDEAKVWIELRHTSSNGSGVASWLPLAKQRFKGDGDTPALQALTFVLAHGGLSEAEKAAGERINFSTFERLIKSSVVRDKLGFDVDVKQLVSGLPAAELMKPLLKIYRDLAIPNADGKTLSVRSVIDSKAQAAYVKGFSAKDLPDLSKAGESRPVASVSDADFQSRGPRKGGKRKPADPAMRRTLAPKAFHLDFKAHSKISKIFNELKRIKLENAENAVAVLFRVFLELSVDRYLEKNKIALFVMKNGHKNDKSMRSKIDEAIDHLESQGKARKNYGGVVRAQSTASSPLHADVLNGYVHNQFTLPTVDRLRHAWDEAQGFFEDLWA